MPTRQAPARAQAQVPALVQGQEQGREQEQEPPPQEQPRQPLPQNSSRRGVAGWSLDELNELFYSGAPSNSPSPNPSALARGLSPEPWP